MSHFFRPNDLAALAQESKIAKQKLEAIRLKGAAKSLFETIMHGEEDGDGQIVAESTKPAKLMELFIDDIRNRRRPLAMLWSCFTTKFARSEKFPNRDCRDEMMINPFMGEETTHLQYCIATEWHRGLGIDNSISIWKVLRFTDLLHLIEGELGRNFICHHKSELYDNKVWGDIYRQIIMVEYLPKGRTPEQESLVQAAIANHRRPIMSPEEEEEAEHAADYDF